MKINIVSTLRGLIRAMTRGQSTESQRKGDYDRRTDIKGEGILSKGYCIGLSTEDPDDEAQWLQAIEAFIPLIKQIQQNSCQFKNNESNELGDKLARQVFATAEEISKSHPIIGLVDFTRTLSRASTGYDKNAENFHTSWGNYYGDAFFEKMIQVLQATKDFKRSTDAALQVSQI